MENSFEEFQGLSLEYIGFNVIVPKRAFEKNNVIVS